MFTVSVFIYLLISQPFFFNLKFQVTGPVGVRRIYLYKIHHSTFCPGGSNPCRKQNKNQDRWCLLIYYIPTQPERTFKPDMSRNWEVQA